MNLITLVIVVLLVAMLFGSAPVHAWSTGWGYGPSGVVGILLVVLLVLVLTGRL